MLMSLFEVVLTLSSNGPFCGVAVILFLVAFPSDGSKEWQQKPIRQFDFLGSVLVLAATVLIVFGLNEGGTGASPWKSAIPVATLTAGILAWFLLVAWQWYSNKHTSIAGIFPLGIWKSRVLAAGLMSVLTIAGSVYH
jgi:multisubunit Na+/H+ antiporter MnhB subunit